MTNQDRVMVVGSILLQDFPYFFLIDRSQKFFGSGGLTIKFCEAAGFQPQINNLQKKIYYLNYQLWLINYLIVLAVNIKM